jgi:hypothetical protein
MKKTALFGALVLAALWAVAASARMEAPPSGDTCTASGSGPVYTLHITLPPGAQQFGFAFGAHGAAITNAVIPGANGNFTTQGVAANTSGVWISDAPLPATNNVTLTTSGKASSLTVVPASTTQPAYFRPITCRFTSGTGLQHIAFSINHNAAYNARTGAWGLIVKIPAGGIVSAQQLVPTVGTGAAAAVTPKPLVQAHRVAMKTGGKVTLMLRPTSKAMTVLRTNTSLHVRLKVTLDASDGRSTTKLLSLTLSK